MLKLKLYGHYMPDLGTNTNILHPQQKHRNDLTPNSQALENNTCHVICMHIRDLNKISIEMSLESIPI
jgi:hypothetical protein